LRSKHGRPAPPCAGYFTILRAVAFAATETVLVAGTASHVGKSTVAAGLCRLLSRRGVSVAPFKAQNMSNNAHVALTPTGEWGEIGVSQRVQATAAGVSPTTDTNPVLLKPHGDGESQLVVDGRPVGQYSPGDYYEHHWGAARDAAVAAHERLADPHEVIVAEGAGSIAEINLHDRDLANLETARFADATVLLVVDIERGGAFATLYGTVELLPGWLREQVGEATITKFRGDRSLLADGVAEIEERTGVPILGVVPHDDPELPAEDSLSLPADGERSQDGDDDGVPASRAVTIGVPRLPRISNATDVEPLAREPGVRIAYLPPDGSLHGVDAVLLPGSKNTVDDLLALERGGLGDEIRRFDGPVVGVCGGYQMLGERIENAAIEGTGDQTVVDGLGVLPVETTFRTDKHVERVTVDVEAAPLLPGASGTATGYEIHMGRSQPTAAVSRPLGDASAATDRALGTYLHGLFENPSVREPFVDAVFAHAGTERPAADARARSPYDAAAELIEDHVDYGELFSSETVARL